MQCKKIMRKAYQQLKNLPERVKRIMCKQMELFSGKRPRKRWIDMEKDYEYLLHVMGLPNESAFVHLDVAEVDVLRGGEAIFLWESKLATTEEEAVAMAKRAAEKMAPEPGNVILIAAIELFVDIDCGLDTIEQIVDAIFSEAGTGYIADYMVYGVQFCDEQKGIRFVLATSEGRADTADTKEHKSISHALGNEPKERKNSSPAPASEPVGDGCIDELALAAMEDYLLPIAVEIVLETGGASVSMLQRRLKLGYSRAARLVDQMEQMGYVGPFDESKPRQVFITHAKWQEIQMGGSSALTTDGTASDDATL